MRHSWPPAICTFLRTTRGSYASGTSAAPAAGSVGAVVTHPLSDYLRYEFAVYRHTMQAGEDVRILDLTSQPDPGLPTQDFWLFDEAAVVRMDYGQMASKLAELLEGLDPALCVARKRLALKRAVAFEEYVTLHQCD